MSARESLIDTTKNLLSAQGYEATSPAQIQSASGVGQGSFYHHFASKADLAEAALTSLA
ncbi:MAG: helix-turn-helix domain-containing protein, partial [Actinomycetota bacterium]